MISKRVLDLVSACNEAMGGGVDFPTIWHEIIKGHPLVGSGPIQRHDGTKAYLEIRLLNGQSLILETDGKEFRLM
jgi:hypothetical protein